MSLKSVKELISGLAGIVMIALLAFSLYVLFFKSESDIYANYVQKIEAALAAKDCIGAQGRLVSMQIYVGNKVKFHSQFTKYLYRVDKVVKELKRTGQCT